MIGTLADDEWAGMMSEEGTGRAGAPPSPLLTVPNVTAHPSMASVPTSYYFVHATISLLAVLFRFLLQIPPLRFGIMFIPLFRPFPGRGNA